MVVHALQWQATGEEEWGEPLPRNLSPISWEHGYWSSGAGGTPLAELGTLFL